VTRLQKYVSVMSQANNSNIAENGASDASMFTIHGVAAPDPAEVRQYFDVNIAPYLKTTLVKTLTKGVLVALPDGSGFFLSRANNNMVTIFCINYKECEKLDSTVRVNSGTNEFYASGENPHSRFGVGSSGWVPGQNDAVCPAGEYSCCKKTQANSAQGCGKWIQDNGWEIPADYPW
jgi:hypothetical protein